MGHPSPEARPAQGSAWRKILEGTGVSTCHKTLCPFAPLLSTSPSFFVHFAHGSWSRLVERHVDGPDDEAATQPESALLGALVAQLHLPRQPEEVLG